jgi:hypothetical protein
MEKMKERIVKTSEGWRQKVMTIRIFRGSHGEYHANEVDLRKLAPAIRLDSAKTIDLVPLGVVEAEFEVAGRVVLEFWTVLNKAYHEQADSVLKIKIQEMRDRVEDLQKNIGLDAPSLENGYYFNVCDWILGDIDVVLKAVNDSALLELQQAYLKVMEQFEVTKK